jgi:anti-anti-sigma regulatory factor
VSKSRAIEGKPLAVIAEGELDVAIILEQGEKTSCVRLQGSIDISLAEELKTILVNALRAGGEIRVLSGDVTYLDVTAVQLLWAAEREAGRVGVRWIFGDALPEPVRANLVDAGFDESLFTSNVVETTGEIG